jgi:hypothetical protein
VCVIDDDRDRALATLAALDRASLQLARVALLRPAGEGEHAAGTTWLLGANDLLYDGAGQPIAAADLRTAETLLILRAGDIPSPTYIASCLDILARQPQLGFVGCWKRISDAGTTWLQTFPLDTALELAPFCEQSPFSRAVMRTPPERLLIDLFDPQAGAYGELAYLWKLDSGRQRGLLIPEPLITQPAETATAPSPSTLTYLIANDDSPWRKARLARFLLAVVGASHDAAAVPRLRQERDMFERQIQSIYHSKVWKLIQLYRRIGSWRRSAQRHGRGLGQRALIRARRWWGRVRHSEV